MTLVSPRLYFWFSESSSVATKGVHSSEDLKELLERSDSELKLAENAKAVDETRRGRGEAKA